MDESNERYQPKIQKKKITTPKHNSSQKKSIKIGKQFAIYQKDQNKNQINKKH